MNTKPIGDIGLQFEKKSLARFFIGILTGAILFACLLAILLAFTDLELRINTDTMPPVAYLLYLAIIPLALMEEIAFRSYAFFKLKGIVGLRITQVIVAFAFALYHVVNGQSVWSSLIGPGTWAFIFGIAATWSGGIAMPLGIHTAVNALQSLTGMSNGMPSLLRLQYQSGIPEAIRRTEGFTGVYLQIFILFTGLLLTEIYF